MATNRLNELFKDKNKLLMIVPIILAIMFGFVFFASKNKKEENTLNSNQQMAAILEPTSKEETVPENKANAYEQDKLAQQKLQLKESETVRGSDFYWDMIKKEDKHNEREKQKIQRMQSSDPYSEIIAGASSDESDYQESSSFSKKMRSQLANIDDEETFNEMLHNAKKDERLRYQLEQDAQFNKDLLLTVKTSLPGGDPQEINPTTNQPPKEKIIEPEEPADDSVFILGDDGKRRRRSKIVIPGQNNLIKACVHGDQILVTGSTVRMRLLEPLMVGGIKIPANTIFYGSATLGSSRLKVSVDNLRSSNFISPVSFVIYDNDAIEGLNLPNNMKAEAAKRMEQGLLQGVNLPISSIGTMTSEIASAITVTTQIAKQILNMSLAQVKVHVKANYQVYIQEETKVAKARRQTIEAELEGLFLKMEEQKLNDPDQTNPLRSLIDKL